MTKPVSKEEDGVPRKELGGPPHVCALTCTCTHTHNYGYLNRSMDLAYMSIFTMFYHSCQRIYTC